MGRTSVADNDMTLSGTTEASMVMSRRAAAVSKLGVISHRREAAGLNDMAGYQKLGEGEWIAVAGIDVADFCG